VKLGQLTLATTVVAAMVLQVLGAVRVRIYARKLWREEMAKSEAPASLDLGSRAEKGP